MEKGSGKMSIMKESMNKYNVDVEIFQNEKTVRLIIQNNPIENQSFPYSHFGISDQDSRTDMLDKISEWLADQEEAEEETKEMEKANHPEPGKVYQLTGTGKENCISNGNSWSESQVTGKRLSMKVISIPNVRTRTYPEKWTPENAKIKAGTYGRLGSLKKTTAISDLNASKRWELEHTLHRKGILDTLPIWRPRRKTKIFWNPVISQGITPCKA